MSKRVLHHPDRHRPIVFWAAGITLIAAAGCQQAAITQGPGKNAIAATQQTTNSQPPPLPPGSATIDSSSTSPATAPLGSFDNPVRADGVTGQQAYLSRLRTASGQPIEYTRTGTFSGRTPGQFLDGYQITSPDGSSSRVIYMDLYHPGYTEPRALPGYKLAPEPGPPSGS